MVPNKMETKYLPFEEKVKDIDLQISELIKCGEKKGIDYSGDVRRLEKDRVGVLKELYSNLSAWETVLVARHPDRPHFVDYVDGIVKEYVPLEGDRYFGRGKTILGGFGRIGIEKVVVFGQEKGRKNEEKVYHNFGCPMPEDYRKAKRLMKLAEKFELPIVSFIDTPGAFPGIEAEERGQAEAISRNLFMMPMLKVPMFAVNIGEGGSGGALGIGVPNNFAALEYSYYSVISPEGGAGILWKDGTKMYKAAESLKVTARDAYKLRAIEDIIKEPLGGAHRNYHDIFGAVENHLVKKIREFKGISVDKLIEQRSEMIGKRAGDWMTAENTKGLWN